MHLRRQHAGRWKVGPLPNFMKRTLCNSEYQSGFGSVHRVRSAKLSAKRRSVQLPSALLLLLLPRVCARYIDRFIARTIQEPRRSLRIRHAWHIAPHSFRLAQVQTGAELERECMLQVSSNSSEFTHIE